MSEFRTLVIHHSATPLDVTAADIKHYHINTNHWVDIGYHYVIEAGGEVVVGRKLPRLGAHAPPNEGRIGICLVGDNTKRKSEWTFQQKHSAVELVGALLFAMPWLSLERHCDVMAPGHTVCPATKIDWLIDLVGG